MFDYADSLTPAKQKLSVLVLGSYSDPCYDRLETLKIQLQNSGYNNTSLVADHTEESVELQTLQFSNYPLYTYKKSIQWIEQSQVNLFVFFKDCPFGSVISEMIISILKFNQFTCSSFFSNKELNLIVFQWDFLVNMI